MPRHTPEIEEPTYRSEEDSITLRPGKTPQAGRPQPQPKNGETGCRSRPEWPRKRVAAGTRGQRFPAKNDTAAKGD